MDYAYFHPLLFLFVGFLDFKGERLTVSEEQNGQIYTYSGRPQTSALPVPDRLQSNSTTPTEGEPWQSSGTAHLSREDPFRHNNKHVLRQRGIICCYYWR